MKTIEVSDEDYGILMGLSKELQLQDNNGQAFPYFWEPSSDKLVTNVNDEGEEVIIYDYDIGDSFSLEQYAERMEDLWKEYLMYQGDIEFREYDEEEDCIFWPEFVRDSDQNARIFTQDWERKCEHNPSLFKSDVKGFCETNQHHLGRNPSAYSRSIWRMPKMEALVGAIYRINKQPTETVNDEARRFVWKKENIVEAQA